MGLNRGTLILTAVLLAFPASARQMSPEELQLKAKHVGRLGPRSGYEGNKAWDELVRLAPEFEDEQILGTLFSAKVEQGAPLVRKRADLLAVFKANPTFFVEAGSRFYGGDQHCLLFWLVPASGAISFEEVDRAAEKALARSSNDQLQRFRVEAHAWRARIKADDSAARPRDCTRPGPGPKAPSGDSD